LEGANLAMLDGAKLVADTASVLLPLCNSAATVDSATICYEQEMSTCRNAVVAGPMTGVYRQGRCGKGFSSDEKGNRVHSESVLNFQVLAVVLYYHDVEQIEWVVSM
jgi:hypothetical protein